MMSINIDTTYCRKFLLINLIHYIRIMILLDAKYKGPCICYRSRRVGAIFLSLFFFFFYRTFCYLNNEQKARFIS